MIAALMLMVVVLNEDCNHFLVEQWRAKTPVTRESIRAYANRYLKGPVTHYVVNASCGLVAPFDSQAADCKWRLHDRLKCRCEGFSRFWVETLRTLNAEGIDPYAELIAAARARQRTVWVSIRMNDVHSVIEHDTCGNSDLWREHPEFRREPGRPVMKGVGRWHYAFDFAHAEVRDAYLKAIGELASRYAVDGLELDFTRHQFYFQPRRERQDAHWLTDLVRRARQRVKTALIVRVPTTPALCRAHGMEVEEWMREGLVDVVVPANLLDMANYDFPVGEWNKLAESSGRSIQIIPGCDAQTMLERKNERSQRLTRAAEYNGWSDLILARGGAGVYFFNHFNAERAEADCRRKMGLEDSDGFSPAKIRARPRAYPVSHCDYWSLEGAKHDRMTPQLPMPLDGKHSLRISIGQVGPARHCEVRLGLDVPIDRLAGLALNGVPPATVVREDPKCWLGPHCISAVAFACTFPIPAVRDGDNRLTFAPAAVGCRITACELFLK